MKIEDVALELSNIIVELEEVRNKRDKAKYQVKRLEVEIHRMFKKLRDNRTLNETQENFK